jgi:hypothetical protein
VQFAAVHTLAAPAVEAIVEPVYEKVPVPVTCVRSFEPFPPPPSTIVTVFPDAVTLDDVYVRLAFGMLRPVIFPIVAVSAALPQPVSPISTALAGSWNAQTEIVDAPLYDTFWLKVSVIVSPLLIWFPLPPLATVIPAGTRPTCTAAKFALVYQKPCAERTW